MLRNHRWAWEAAYIHRETRVPGYRPPPRRSHTTPRNPFNGTNGSPYSGAPRRTQTPRTVPAVGSSKRVIFQWALVHDLEGGRPAPRGLINIKYTIIKYNSDLSRGGFANGRTVKTTILLSNTREMPRRMATRPI
jgi:hypothetical protein